MAAKSELGGRAITWHDESETWRYDDTGLPIGAEAVMLFSQAAKLAKFRKALNAIMVIINEALVND